MSEWVLFVCGAAVTLLGLLAVVLFLGKTEGDDERESNRILDRARRLGRRLRNRTRP